RAGAAGLRELRIEGRGVVVGEANGSQVLAWCPITTAVDWSARLTTDADEVSRADGFFSIFFKVDGIKSGMHHPDGLFWIRRPTAGHCRVEEPVALDL